MWVQLKDVWSEAIHDRHYDEPVRQLLGEMLAITTLIANNINHKERLSLHVVGDGPIKTAFAECQNQEALRGIVRPNEDTPKPTNKSMSFKELIGQGRIALTMQFASGETYQGLVDTDYDRLEESMEQYFENSEQLSTAIMLASAEEVVTGCFLQKLPSQTMASDIELVQDEAEWIRLVSLFRTIRTDELNEKDVKTILRSVFPTDSIYLDEPKHLMFRCECSRSRSSNALRTLSRDEIQDLLMSQGSIKVTCEFCGRLYEYIDEDIDKEINSV